MELRRKDSIVVILGPTASGKSSLAVDLALKFKGEIVSADSRQVYKGMDIGSGKITKKEMKSIPHYLLDVASPKRQFSIARYQKLAEKSIVKIIRRKKLPFICGGSAFYINSIVEGLKIPAIAPDEKIRKQLSRKSTLELYKELKKIDPRRASEIDSQNPRRLIRAIEIVKKSKKPVPSIQKKPNYNSLLIGIKKPTKEIDNLIEKRLEKRLKGGMVKEVKSLRESGISWQRLESFGLEYKWISLYFQSKIDYEEMKVKLLGDIKKFSRKQMTWWKNNPEIKWIKNFKEAELIIQNFLKF